MYKLKGDPSSLQIMFDSTSEITSLSYIHKRRKHPLCLLIKNLMYTNVKCSPKNLTFLNFKPKLERNGKLRTASRLLTHLSKGFVSDVLLSCSRRSYFSFLLSVSQAADCKLLYNACYLLTTECINAIFF